MIAAMRGAYPISAANSAWTAAQRRSGAAAQRLELDGWGSQARSSEWRGIMDVRTAKSRRRALLGGSLVAVLVHRGKVAGAA